MHVDIVANLNCADCNKISHILLIVSSFRSSGKFLQYQNTEK